MAGEFEGRTVVVTGAGGMLGRVLCRRFADQGARLVMIDMAQDAIAPVRRKLEASGTECAAFILDLVSEPDIERVGAEVCAQFPAIDVLCNNAGMHHGDTNLPVDQVRQAAWLRSFSVNTIAPLLLAQALRPALKAAGGAIVNQSSMASYSPMNPYGITKLALNAMTHGMASAFGTDGIRVNAVAPGLIDTELNRTVMSADIFDRVQGTQMLRRNGTPDDIAELTLFLASDRARFITAEIVACDGGSSVRGWHS